MLGLNILKLKVIIIKNNNKMITGELVLPNTPTVTGYPSYNPCRVDNSTSTPAA